MTERHLFRRPPTWRRWPIRIGTAAHPRRVLVTGATGFIGRHLCRHLIGSGHRIVALVRDVDRAADLYGPHVETITSLGEIDTARHIDTIVNLAGESIAGGWWTARRRSELLDSRLRVTSEVVSLIARLQAKPSVLISASAIGYYGVRGDEEITEADRGRPVFQSHLCQAWELAAQAAEAHGVRVCRLRFGLVLGRGGGAWPGLARSARLGFRIAFGSGAQWLSWIHIRDVLRLIDFCIEREDIDGAINATAPQPVRQVDFARAAARGWLCVDVRLPERTLRFALGEMAQLLVDGQRVLPMKAQCASFRFSYADIASAVRDLLQPRRIATAAHIMYDTSCPVCDLEMKRYCRGARRQGFTWRLDDIAERPEMMSRYLLDVPTARERVYVVTDDGTVTSGMEALLTIWNSLPGWRWLALLLSQPPLRLVANATYDFVLAPLIYRWGERRRMLAALATKVGH